MKWLFVIDPIEGLNYETDSTYAIMKEAYRQGIEVYFCRMQDIFFKEAIKCVSYSCSFISDNYKLGSSMTSFLDAFDTVFMRKDPPYDMIFHYCTELLSLAGTLVVNSPQALRDFNEKLIILPFTEFIPETMVTSNESQIKTFLENHPSGLILKSLSSYQGRSVNWIRQENEKTDEILRSYTQNFTEPVMIQEYLPDVSVGDKRILVLGGKIIGAVLREPLENNYLANLGQGGIARKTSITEREYEIARRISDFLLKNGLHFIGLDVIGNYLTEINITCPTGIVHINKLNNTLLEKEIVQYFSHLASNLE
jgi:glutathione synthase